MKLGFMASHNGSTAMAIVKAIRDGELPAGIACFISNNKEAPALGAAAALGIPCYHLSSRTHPDADDLDAAIRDTLLQHGATHVVLSGYMKKLGPKTLAAFHNRILNVHPSLLPKYGGKGMYGRRVHEAVLEAGESVTGVTVHLADDEYDHGNIVAQCQVPVLAGDTPETLAARVQAEERKLFVSVLRDIATGRLSLDG
ncbi:MAG TPA: phosphoribosylglycinamide formyltransferase [Firmicutes bacterium]|nr:phosphoribosylglycinamide formyltransferase [Bacillota bacterium]